MATDISTITGMGVNPDFLNGNEFVENQTQVSVNAHSDIIQTFQKLLALAGITVNYMLDNEVNGYQMLSALQDQFQARKTAVIRAPTTTNQYCKIGELKGLDRADGTKTVTLSVSGFCASFDRAELRRRVVATLTATSAPTPAFAHIDATLMQGDPTGDAYALAWKPSGADSIELWIRSAATSVEDTNGEVTILSQFDSETFTRLSEFEFEKTFSWGPDPTGLTEQSGNNLNVITAPGTANEVRPTKTVYAGDAQLVGGEATDTVQAGSELTVLEYPDKVVANIYLEVVRTGVAADNAINVNVYPIGGGLGDGNGAVYVGSMHEPGTADSYRTVYSTLADSGGKFWVEDGVDIPDGTYTIAFTHTRIK